MEYLIKKILSDIVALIYNQNLLPNFVQTLIMQNFYDNVKCYNLYYNYPHDRLLVINLCKNNR